MPAFELALTLSMLLIAGGIIFFMMFLFWLIQLKTKNAGIVDLGWALGIVLSAGVYTVFSPGDEQRQKLFTLMVFVWGIRLSIMLFGRLIGSAKEDPRYQEIRKNWKNGETWKFFLFFQLQGLIALVLSLPFLITAFNTKPGISSWEMAGFYIWALGFMGEAAADRQLRLFKLNPANQGKPCNTGLWKYSRHPNYFFEWIIWAGYFVFASASPWGWVSIISPLLMLYFLTSVSGIPPAEAQAIRTKGEAYRQYQKATSPFFPWPPKKPKGFGF